MRAALGQLFAARLDDLGGKSAAVLPWQGR